jgi:hypothetical protein
MNVIGIIILNITIVTGIICVLTKRSRKGGIVLLLCAIAFCLWQWRSEVRWAQEFSEAPDGVSTEQVIATLGKPSIIADSDKSPFGYSLTSNNKNVKKELRYVSFFLPEQFAFGFDERGILIDRYHYVSP